MNILRDRDGRRRSWADVGGMLAGPRFVDTLVRAVAVLLAGASWLTAFTQGLGAIYGSLALLGGSLTLASAWAPRAAAALALSATLIHAVVAPDVLNPMFLCFSAAVGVCVSKRRWFSFVQCTGMHIAAVAAAYGFHTADAEFSLASAEALFWFFAAALGVCAALVQARIDREIASRVEAARQGERELQRLRLSMATDTHDTVAHALATESAIIRVIGLEREQGVDDRTLAELAVVNARAQRQLRQLLGKLSATISPTAPKEFRSEMVAALSAIASGARAGGFTMSTSEQDLPERLPAALVETAQFVLFELAGNVVKHAAAQEPIDLAVVFRPGAGEGGGDVLELSSRSPVDGVPTFAPRSLGRRAAGLGGTCTVRAAEDGRAEVLVRLPTGTIG